MAQVRSNKLFSGTRAKRLALDTSNLEPSDIFREDSGDEYEWSGSNWYQTSIGGALQTTLSTGLNVTSDRELDVSSGEDAATWTEAEDITYIEFTLGGTAGGFAYYTLDAPDAATQTTNLANGGSASTPAQRQIIYVGETISRAFPTGKPLRRFGAGLGGGTITTLSIVAGK